MKNGIILLLSFVFLSTMIYFIFAHPQSQSQSQSQSTTPTSHVDMIDFSKKTDLQVAELMSIISKATYDPPSKAEIKRLPFLQNAQKITATQSGVLAYLMTQGDEMIIAFRGSDNINNWTHNLDLLQTTIDEEGFKLHKGFYESYLSIKDQIISNLQSKKPKSIRLTGHSLGGALAQITAYFLKKSGENINSVYTFGAPIVGNEQWHDAYQKQLQKQSFTWELFTDPIPDFISMDETLNTAGIPVGQIRYLDCPCHANQCVVLSERKKMNLDSKHLLLQIKTMLYVKGLDILIDQIDTSSLSRKDNMLIRQKTALKSAKFLNIEICTNVFSYHWLIDSFDEKYLAKVAENIETSKDFDLLELLSKIEPLHGIENYERVLYYLNIE